MKFILWISHKNNFSLSSSILSFSFDLSFIRWHKMLLPDISCLTWIQHFSTSSIWLFFLCTNPCTFLISSKKKRVLSRSSASLYFCISLLPHFLWVWVPFINPLPSTFFPQLNPNFVCFVFSLNPISQEVYHLLFLFLKSLSLVYSCVGICTSTRKTHM